MVHIDDAELTDTAVRLYLAQLFGAACAVAVAAAAPQQPPGFTWGREPMRGVNIGGW